MVLLFSFSLILKHDIEWELVIEDNLFQHCTEGITNNFLCGSLLSVNRIGCDAILLKRLKLSTLLFLGLCLVYLNITFHNKTCKLNSVIQVDINVSH